MGPAKVVTRKRARKPRPTIVYPPLGQYYLFPLEPIQLAVCWSRQLQSEFRNAQMYTFIWNSLRLPGFEEALVTEFLKNYDPNDNTSAVQGREVVIDETLVSEALHLPTGEQTIDPSPEPVDFIPQSYFKTGQAALEKRQGWKTAEALTPELMEWFRFVLRRLFLTTHMAYLSPKLLYPATQTMNGMVFNWASYVATRIHFEVDKKLQKGTFSVLLSASYISIIVRHVLNKPVEEKRRKPAGSTDSPKSTDPAVPSVSVSPVTLSEDPEEQRSPLPSPTATSPSRILRKNKSAVVPQGCSRDHTTPLRQPVFTATHDAEAGSSQPKTPKGPVQLKLRASLLQLADMVGALEDTTTLTNQLKEVRAANTKCQEEIKQLQLTLQTQQVRAQEWK